mmetsp:Transcript_54590/g.168090  ORF Transcript_54590/g.168090 Transcript_54590/m.168090 type:complete len:624 (-) Transcript_54590:266-2137(-)
MRGVRLAVGVLARHGEKLDVQVDSRRIVVIVPHHRDPRRVARKRRDPAVRFAAAGGGQPGLQHVAAVAVVREFSARPALGGGRRLRVDELDASEVRIGDDAFTLVRVRGADGGTRNEPEVLRVLEVRGVRARGVERQGAPMAAFGRQRPPVHGKLFELRVPRQRGKLARRAVAGLVVAVGGVPTSALVSRWADKVQEEELGELLRNGGILRDGGAHDAGDFGEALLAHAELFAGVQREQLLPQRLLRLDHLPVEVRKPVLLADARASGRGALWHGGDAHTQPCPLHVGHVEADERLQGTLLCHHEEAMLQTERGELWIADVGAAEHKARGERFGQLACQCVGDRVLHLDSEGGAGKETEHHRERVRDEGVLLQEVEERLQRLAVLHHRVPFLVHVGHVHHERAAAGRQRLLHLRHRRDGPCCDGVVGERLGHVLPHAQRALRVQHVVRRGVSEEEEEPQARDGPAKTLRDLVASLFDGHRFVGSEGRERGELLHRENLSPLRRVVEKLTQTGLLCRVIRQTQQIAKCEGLKFIWNRARHFRTRENVSDFAPGNVVPAVLDDRCPRLEKGVHPVIDHLLRLDLRCCRADLPQQLERLAAFDASRGEVAIHHTLARAHVRQPIRF